MAQVQAAHKTLPGTSSPLSTEAVRSAKLGKDFWLEMICPAQDGCWVSEETPSTMCFTASLPNRCFYQVLRSTVLIIVSGEVFKTVCKQGRKICWFSSSYTKYWIHGETSSSLIVSEGQNNAKLRKNMHGENGFWLISHFHISFFKALSLKQPQSKAIESIWFLQQTFLMQGDVLAHKLQLVLILGLPIKHTVSLIFHNHIDKHYCKGI